jgi:hypothetical protein
MDQLVKETTEIKLHLNNITGKKGFTLSKEWNPNTKLLQCSSAYRSDKTQEDKYREGDAKKKKETK